MDLRSDHSTTEYASKVMEFKWGSWKVMEKQYGFWEQKGKKNLKQKQKQMSQ